MRFAYTGIPLALCAALVLAGCATTGGSQTENTIYDTHRRVVKLESEMDASITKLNETAAELAARVDASDQQMRTIQGSLDENQVKLAALQRNLDELMDVTYSINKMSRPSRTSDVTAAGGFQVEPPPRTPARPINGDDMSPIGSSDVITSPPADVRGPTPAAPAPAPTPAPAPAPSHSGSPESDYQQAQKSFAKQDYASALDQFSTFLQRYPNSEHAANAMFWRAKSFQGLEQYREAIDAYESLRANYATSTKTPYAIHQEAVCHARLGQSERAIQLMEEVIRDYPMTPAADQAKSDLQKLRGN
jgi:tol-pal system protein YbgF